MIVLTPLPEHNCIGHEIFEKVMESHGILTGHKCTSLDSLPGSSAND